MNSINKDLDRLDGQVVRLLQKVEDLQADNHRLLQKINALEDSYAKSTSREELETLVTSLSQYIDQLDHCIDVIKTQ